jgi:uncharacterized membrane protein
MHDRQEHLKVLAFATEHGEVRPVLLAASDNGGMGMTTPVAMLAGIGIGAAITYFLDPYQGRQRRSLIADQVVHAQHVGADASDTTMRDASNRSRGLFASLASALRPDEADDRVVVDRVRSKMGRVVRHPHAILVTSHDGAVTLRGQILADDLDALIRAVSSVRGVRSVENQMEVFQTPGDIPLLQGTGSRPGQPDDILQTSWSPTTRVLVSASGLALAAGGIARRDVFGGLLAAAGTTLSARALTNMEFKRLFGFGAGRRAIDFHKTITVLAPVEEVYRFWRNLDNLPRSMEHVREVRVHHDDASYWTVGGPAGMPVSFNAVITRDVPNELIAWKTREGEPIQHSGIVRFDPAPNGGTRVVVRMSYNPIAGALGHTVASIFGVDPKHAMDEDLVRFKSLIEEGKTTARGEEVTWEEVGAESQGW